MRKKIITLLLIGGLAISAFGETSADIQIANSLASDNIIHDWSWDTSKYRLADNLSRLEAMNIALTMAGIQLNTACKGKFVDATATFDLAACRTVETAAEHGFINSSKTKVRPYSAATRSEALAIFMRVLPDETPSSTYLNFWTAYKGGYTFGDEWQAKVFYDYIRKVTKNTTMFVVDPRASAKVTRGDAFIFAKNIFDYKLGR